MSDIILALDKKYSGANAVPCPNEGKALKVGNKSFSEHGNMGVHSSGAFLICGRCGAQEPTSRVD